MIMRMKMIEMNEMCKKMMRPNSEIFSAKNQVMNNADNHRKKNNLQLQRLREMEITRGPQVVMVMGH